MEPILPGPGNKVPPVLTDHVLEEFLVRIDASADLIRASAACKTFRRLITDPTFLSRYRSIHPPQLLGFVSHVPPHLGFVPFGSIRGFLPAAAPHPNAPAALAFAGAADFTFNHLPDRGRAGWSCCDARDGRVIMLSTHREGDVVIPELAVCDPLTQGYMLLPPIPDDLVASVLVQIQEESIRLFHAFFDPSGGYEEEYFRVICWTCCPTMGAIFIYSSVSGSWTHASITWHALGLDVELQPEHMILPGMWPSYAYGCLYWKEAVNNKLIKLNINNMEFSIVNLPADHENRDVMAVEVGEGRIGMFSHIRDLGNPQPLRYSVRQNESENANEHPVETTIPLPNECDFYVMDGVAKGYIFLKGYCFDQTRRSAFLSLEIKTRKVEKVCLSNYVPQHLIPYFGFPPFMSPRRV